jgi:hypothetical protein
LKTFWGPVKSRRNRLLSQISRNHPELDWRVATTEHFEIAYPARLDSIAARAAPIAETTYDSLSASLCVTFDERIRVHLTDQDGLPFGFAAPLGTGYANIWVHPNDWTQISNDTAPRPRRCRWCSTAGRALVGSSLCGAGLRGVFAQLPAGRLLRKRRPAGGGPRQGSRRGRAHRN